VTADCAIAAALTDVRSRLDRAARAAGRDPASVTLVAVSKTHPPEAIRAAFAAGQLDFGENYAQELERKRRELADLPGIRWHFIGALQSNKAKLVLPSVLVHALDRDSVAEALARRAAPAGCEISALAEVNLAGEASKSGLPPAELPAALERWERLPGLRLRGLMCIPPPADDAGANRPWFRRLRELRDSLHARHPGLELLSMGMTADFETAIAEGATHVRVGTAIFGARDATPPEKP